MRNQEKRKQEGITLIALIITIIVLLILAAVSISTLAGENGILTKAQEAANKMNEAQEEEQNAIDQMNNEIENILGGTTTDSDEDIYVSGWDEEEKVNTPTIESGMIPIKWVENATYEDGGIWTICSANDSSWYNYIEQEEGTDGTSMWANVMLSDGTYKEGTTATVGTEVAG